MFCKNCGKQLEDNAKFCNNCGTSTGDNQPLNADSATTSANNSVKIFSVLSYIGILWLVGLLVKPEKDDPKVRFHVGQGIVLTIFSVVVNIVFEIINKILVAVFGVFGIFTAGIATIIISLLGLAVSATIIALMIIGIVNAVKEEQKPLPFIGGFAFYK